MVGFRNAILSLPAKRWRDADFIKWMGPVKGPRGIGIEDDLSLH